MLSGGYDRRVNVIDVRERPLGENAIRVRLGKEVKDIEQLAWHPRLEHNFAVSTESGVVLGYDMRQIKEPLFRIEAHEKACSNLSFSPHIPNMMATCSTDETVKIWDISHNGGSDPKCLAQKKMGMGELFSLSYYKDIPWVLAAGGSKGEIAVWDSEENEQIKAHFTPFLDKSSIPAENLVEEEESEEEQDNDMESDEEDLKVKQKKNRKEQKKTKVKKINTIAQGIQKIQALKNKGK